jgi:hypothetical protein
MAYDTIKNCLTLILNSVGLVESSVIDFKNAPASEYETAYILKPLSGENQNNTIIDRFDDLQEWQIIIGFARSENNDIIQRDAANRMKDIIIKAVDKPSNWEGSVKVMKYKNWEIVDNPSYFIIDIRVEIIDELIHG